MRKNKVLIIDGDVKLRQGIAAFLRHRGCGVREADGCGAALQELGCGVADAVILDHSLKDGTVLDLLPELKFLAPGVAIIVLTGFDSIDLVVQAVKLGAEQFLTKPVEMEALLLALEHCIENQRIRQKEMAINSGDARSRVNPFAGKSSVIQTLASDAARIAMSDCTVLIEGETGTGKGVIAKWLHDNSERHKQPFIDLNCAGLSCELLDTELLGHDKGAFTGAVSTKVGLLEYANRGTVFLDEIGDMDLQVQPKVPKVLEEKKFRHLGGLREYQVDVRMISATHRNLSVQAAREKFRSDLYFRLSTVVLRVPPLRDRKEDIPVLCANLLQGISAAMKKPLPHLHKNALQRLMDYSWPGNVRELRNILEGALIRCEGEITADSLHLEARGTLPPSASKQSSMRESMQTAVRDVEYQHIQQALREANWYVRTAAKELGMPRSILYQRIKALRIERDSQNNLSS
jgi:DNA-binding NtrC family response regulator